MPMADTRIKRFAQPYAVIHRADLHEVLLQTCEATGVEMITNCALSGYTDTGNAVILDTAKGQLESPAMIAADGIWSKTRNTLVESEDPTRMGYLVYRYVGPVENVPSRLAENAVNLWCGPGCHMIHYPLRGGARCSTSSPRSTTKLRMKANRTCRKKSGFLNGSRERATMSKIYCHCSTSQKTGIFRRSTLFQPGARDASR